MSRDNRGRDGGLHRVLGLLPQDLELDHHGGERRPLEQQAEGGRAIPSQVFAMKILKTQLVTKI